jgi:dTDP-4-amino-4,6-dideoxygalactose transaminase
MAFDRLAVLGGPPAFDTQIPLYRARPPDAELLRRPLEAAIASGVLTKGPAVTAFEDALAAKTGSPHAVATSSGLSALVLVLQGLRLEGEVIVPAYAFPAVAQAVLAAGLVPRPVDVDSESWNLDPALAESAVGPRTSAIVAVHTSGFPANAAALESVAARRRVSLVFDAAHALGARIGERSVGTFGAAEVFSFTPSKMVSAGEGGAVTTADRRLAGDVEAGRNYGRTRAGDWTGRGLSARLPEISALLARSSLGQLDDEIARRERVAAAYRAALAATPGIRFQSALRGTTPVYRDVSLRVEPETFGVGRDALRAAIAAEGVETGAYFHPALSDLPLARRFSMRESAVAGAAFPVAKAVAAQVVNLPVGAGVEAETAAQIGALIHRIHEDAARVSARSQAISAPRPPTVDAM